MHRVDCDYCGLPVKVRRVTPGTKTYCCAGCALADRVKTTDGSFPVTPELVLALLAGFAAFNQLLGVLMSWLMAGEGREILATRFWWGSLAAGGFAWLLAMIAQLRSGAVGWGNPAVAVAALALLGLGALNGSRTCALAGTAVMLAWSVRGWGRKRPALKDANRLQERPRDSI